MSPQPYPRKAVAIVRDTSDGAAQSAKLDSTVGRRGGLDGLSRSVWLLLWRLNLTSLLRY